MIETSESAPTVGDEIVINLEDFDKVHGSVVWSFDRNAGVEFEHSIHTALVGHLGFVSSLLPFEEMRPRDRFGRLLPNLQ